MNLPLFLGNIGLTELFMTVIILAFPFVLILFAIYCWKKIK